MFQTKNPRSRYTIGLLAGWPVYGSYAADRFVDYIAQGLQKLALEQDCNLLLGLGVNRLIGERSAHAAWPVLSSESDFVPVGPWNTDGLIVLSPVRSQARSEYLKKYMSDGFPVVFIGHGEGQPSVKVDNELGIWQAVSHLVAHGHRKIAFLAGDTNDPGDSLARLNAYYKALKEFHLEVDPSLVSYGYHNQEDGYRSMDIMLQKKAAFTALVASNDMSAIGAMQAIRQNGLKVPDDIAVIGFDDQPMAAGQDPPLASIHYPLFEAGYQAGNLLMKAIKSGQDIRSTELLLAPRLTRRHSCGCLSGKEKISQLASLTSKKAPKINFRREMAVQDMSQTIVARVNSLQPDQINELCEKLIDAYLEALKKKDATPFHQTFAETLTRVRQAGEDLHIWQEAITVLSIHIRSLLKNAEHRDFSDVLLHWARVEISEGIQHQQEQVLLSQNTITHQLSWLSSYLFSARNEAEIVRILARLPLIGIKFVHVGLFEPDGDDLVARVRYRIPTADQTVPVGRENSGQALHFPTREFPPAGIFPANKPYHLAVLPLVFEDDPMGFVVFESKNLELYAAIVREVAAAIKSVQLHAKVLEMSQTDSLTKVYNRRYFEEYLTKELERSRRYNRPLALAMLDLDHFKDYNDAFGHQAGDQALQEFAKLIQGEIRRNLDIVARYGGEEFVIVMPESDLAGAYKVAERIRARLEALTTIESHLTTSIGVAACRPGQSACDQLISQADKALYSAKKKGRNQVCEYGDTMLAQE